MRTAIWSLALALTFYAGMRWVIYAYDPDTLRVEAVYLAANSYLYGCTSNQGKDCKKAATKFLETMKQTLK